MKNVLKSDKQVDTKNIKIKKRKILKIYKKS